MIIYKITNRINGKVYIGQTIQSLEARWRKHCQPKSNCVCLRNSIQKYGKENFTVEQIDVALDREELNAKEKYWIKYYDSVNPDKGYNLREGGEHSSLTDFIKMKISNTLKGVKKSFETRERMSKSQTGKRLSDETKRRISETSKRLIRTKQHCERISNALKGRKLSEETRRKLSESKKGKHKGLDNPNSKPVVCVETGVLYESENIANKLFKTRHIGECCKGKRKVAKGFHWRYA